MIIKPKPVKIIAEAGVNHNGDLGLAKEMIEIAAEAGANMIKFQSFSVSESVSKSSQKAQYQIKNTGKDESQYDMLTKLEIDREAHLILIDFCQQKNIQFLSSPFDLQSVTLLGELNLESVKIPSGEIVHLPYLEKIAQYKWDIILSTGMSTLGEIEASIHALESAGASRDKMTILHCNTEYPTPYEDVNLKAMQTIASSFQVEVGYSDHTPGIIVPVAAVAMGATVIEKHFTVDKTMDGPDHIASLDPEELKEMISAVRKTETILGSSRKWPSPSEEKNLSIARKSIHSRHFLESGRILTRDDLICKRPGTGISPMQFHQLVGKKVARDIPGDVPIKYEDLV